jgi:uncharacterized membrane protein
MAKAGSIIVGMFVGAILLGVLGWIPILGGLIAGIAAGALAKGAARGLVAGLLAGIIGFIILSFLLTAIGGAAGGGVGAAIGAAIGLGVSALLGLLEIGNIVLAMIGGLIGGAISPRVEIQSTAGPEKQEENDALKTLKLRYAKGEITKKQYDKMLKDLK